MNRFKQTHLDPDIGEFPSLLSLEELKNRDGQGSFVYAKTLQEWENKAHKEFIRSYYPFKFPFLFEMRTHVEIRNNALRNAQIADDDQKKRHFHLMAYKENLILERYFGQTLRKSPYRWMKKQTNAIKQLIDTSMTYKSPIQFGLVYPWSETTLWISILAFLLALMGINVYFSRTRKLN